MSASESLHDDQFINHLKAFQESSGISLYGTHSVIGGVTLPTVSQNLVIKPHDTGNNYYFESRVVGNEGNIHHLGATIKGNERHYSLSAQRPGMKHPEYTEATDPDDFSKGLPHALAASIEFPPSHKKHGDWMSSADATEGTLEELHRTGRYGNTTVNIIGTGKRSLVYDPITRRHL